MSREEAGLLARIKFGVAFLAAFAVAGAASGTPLEELASERHTFIYTSNDINRILSDIKISEEHAAGGELQDILPNASSTRGLRTIDGYQNNVTGIGDRDNWGAADLSFPTLTEQAFRNAAFGDTDGPFGPTPAMDTTYDSSVSVYDPEPRIISQLINNQTSQNPSAVEVFAGGEGGVNATIPNMAAGLGDDDVAYAFDNAAPDEGLSASVNSFITFFGQFFDHGLDLIEKGGNGNVIIPLQEDDPLFNEASPATNFMMLTRATQVDGPGTTINRTAPLVDQNQTYTSHPSVLVVLRDYDCDENGCEATGRLLNGTGINSDGMATWADVKANAAKLGIALDDQDGVNMPLIAVDAYGHFIAGANGFPQLVTAGRVDTHRHHDVDYDTLVACHPDALCEASDGVRTGQNQLIDIAHGTDPTMPGYNAALLDQHFVTGDGRANENIALTAIHHIFHSEHNRLVEFSKAKIVVDAWNNSAQGGLADLNEWLDTEVTELPDPAEEDTLDWNGNRIFSLAKFGTEMQYNRIAFDEFSPTLAGLKDPFEGGPFGYHSNLDPSVTLEFSQSTYRFGHSLLTEDILRFGAGMQDVKSTTLFEAFLNPAAFNEGGTMSAHQAAGELIRGMTRDVANELDEFITPALQTNLLGLPLDLAAINIARGRDVGLPRLNAARCKFYAATGSTQLQPYESWMDFADNMTHESSFVNFLAAYATHPTVIAATTYQGRRDAAQALIDGVKVAGDARDFLYSHGDYANREVAGGNDCTFQNTTGVDDIDYWVGGLAEERQPFGGYLGSTHNFVFETQMEDLQNGDRFYYVARTSDMDLFNELESNSFTALAMRNTDMSDAGSGSVHLNIFGAASHIFEVDIAGQRDPGADNVLATDPEGESALIPLVIREADFITSDINVVDPTRVVQYTGGDHVVIGGTEGRDTIIGGIGDDALWGHGGDDRIEGGDGADLIEGGDGDDIITDLGGPDVIEGGPGNDAIHSGNEEDVLFGDEGNDFIINSSEFGETFLGDGDDFLFDGPFIGLHRGGAGSDWMENSGGGEVVLAGDLFAFPELGENPVKGHDVLVGLGGNNDMDAEGGDDIMVDGPGIDRIEGQLGFDWASFQNDEQGVEVDLATTIFLRPELPVSNATMENRYDRVEGVSGSPMADILVGNDNLPVEMIGNELVDTLDLITGLNGDANGDRATSADEVGAGVVPGSELRDVAADFHNPATGLRNGWAEGEIILGGGGSDVIAPHGGDDIVDGDKSLQVGINTGDGRVAGSMMDIQAEVFAGTLPVAGLSISRVIEDRHADDSADNVDTVVFQGNRDEYVIEGTTDDLGIFTMGDVQQRAGDGVVGNPDGYIRVTHQAAVHPEGSDLLRNIERMRFADQVVEVSEGIAGASNHGNRIATGAPEITGTFEVGGTLTATVGTLADADGLDAEGIMWMWEVDAEGEGFAPLMVPVGVNGNGNPFQVTGSSVVLDGPTAGASVRVVARFQDDANVFEHAVSAPVQVACDAACIAAQAAAGVIPPVATLGATATACDDINAMDIVFENASGAGRPRIDFTIPNVPLANFANAESAFPAEGFGAEAELAVSGIEIVFVNDALSTPGNEVVNATVAPEIAAIEFLDTLEEPTGVVDQDNVNLLWSIRGADVAELVSGPTTASLRVDGVECASIPLDGNSGVLDGTNVVQLTTAGGDPIVAPAEAVPTALFSGTAADIPADSVSFVNASQPGLPRFDITVASVPITLFGDLPAEFSVGETDGCAAPTVCPGDEIAVDSFEVVFLVGADATGVFGGEIAAIENLDADGAGLGTADQNNVNVLFSIRGADVTDLVNGATTIEVRVAGTVVASAVVTGQSAADDATGVAFPAEAGADAAAVAPILTEAAETVDATGRAALNGTCAAGSDIQADTAGVQCRIDDTGRFRCRGRNIAEGTTVTATCVAPNTDNANVVEASFTATADARGRVRTFRGNCFAGQTATPAADSTGLRCRTNARSGAFNCSGNGFNAQEVVTVTCQ